METKHFYAALCALCFLYVIDFVATYIGKPINSDIMIAVPAIFALMQTPKADHVESATTSVAND